jgi:nitroreductase
MHPVSPETLIKQLNWRYAVKKFDATRKISPADWSVLEKALVLSPSSYGLQPWKFVVVNDPAVRAKLKPASWNQSQIVDASHLVVMARRSTMTSADVQRYVDRTVAVRKVPASSIEDYKNMMLGSINAPNADHANWAAKQVYIAMGFLLSAAAMLGIDACPMEGIVPAQYDEILGLPKQGYNTCMVTTLGYRASDDWLANLPKVRFADNEVIQHV